MNQYRVSLWFKGQGYASDVYFQLQTNVVLTPDNLVRLAMVAACRVHVWFAEVGVLAADGVQWSVFTRREVMLVGAENMTYRIDHVSW